MRAEADGCSSSSRVRLPVDALQHIFSYLDWRSLCCCNCTCRAWQAVANDPVLWQQQLAAEFRRPAMLQRYQLIAPQAEGSMQSLAAANLCSRPPADLSEAPNTSVNCQTWAASSSCSHGGSNSSGYTIGGRNVAKQSVVTGAAHKVTAWSSKTLFARHATHPAFTHQSWLARFYTAISSIQGWRLLIKLVGMHPVNTHSSSSNRVSAIGTGTTNPAQSHNKQQQYHQQQRQMLLGHPAPLLMADLQAGAVWACGCVWHQQQEQSCWVRFNLPPELKQNQELAAAGAARRLTAVVQACGPTGWFDAATCSPFQLLDDDMEILLLSHRTGCYPWDQAEEDGEDRYGDLQPQPWNVSVDSCSPMRDTDKQQEGNSVHSSGQQIDRTQLQHQQHLHVQQTQQQHEEQQQGQSQQQTQCKLRMLVYIHYEQLLQVLPWQLPQLLPEPRPKRFRSFVDVGRHLASTPEACLWLHINVCQLHGVDKLGSCVAPLRLRKMGDWGMAFTADQETVQVAIYHGNRHGQKSPEQPPGSQLQQQLQSQVAASASVCASQQPGSLGKGRVSAAMPLQQTSLPCLAEECELVVLGSQVIHGSSAGNDGVPITRAQEAMQELLIKDEVMVDFALFDGSGRLLVGRAGVEVWAKSDTTVHQPAQHQSDHQQQAVSDATHPNQVHFTRIVHMLHFLVDGVADHLWDNFIRVDPAPANAQLDVDLLTLKLTWAALAGLFAPTPVGCRIQAQQQQQQLGAGRSAVGADGSSTLMHQRHAFEMSNIGDVMRELIAAL